MDESKDHICENCYYFSDGEAYGLGPGLGYCELHKKIVRARDSCERFRKKDEKIMVSSDEDIIDEGGDEEAEIEPDLRDDLIDFMDGNLPPL